MRLANTGVFVVAVLVAVFGSCSVGGQDTTGYTVCSTDYCADGGDRCCDTRRSRRDYCYHGWERVNGWNHCTAVWGFLGGQSFQCCKPEGLIHFCKDKTCSNHGTCFETTVARVMLDNRTILEGWHPDHLSFKEYRTVFTAKSGTATLAFENISPGNDLTVFIDAIVVAPTQGGSSDSESSNNWNFENVGADSAAQNGGYSNEVPNGWKGKKTVRIISNKNGAWGGLDSGDGSFYCGLQSVYFTALPFHANSASGFTHTSPRNTNCTGINSKSNGATVQQALRSLTPGLEYTVVFLAASRPGYDAADRYTCACTRGWEGEGCDVDTNECAHEGVDCGNGVCVDEMNNYRCACDAGWEGTRCNTLITTTTTKTTKTTKTSTTTSSTSVSSTTKTVTRTTTTSTTTTTTTTTTSTSTTTTTTTTTTAITTIEGAQATLTDNSESVAATAKPSIPRDTSHSEGVLADLAANTSEPATMSSTNQNSSLKDGALGSTSTGQAAGAASKGRGGRLAGGILGFLSLFLLLGAAFLKKCAPRRRTRPGGMNAPAGAVKSNAAFDPFASGGQQLAGAHGSMSRRGGSIIITNTENVSYAIPMEIETDDITTVSISGSSDDAPPATPPPPAEVAYAEIAYAVPMEIKSGEGAAITSGSSGRSDGAPPATLPEGPYTLTRAVEFYQPAAAVAASAGAPSATLSEVTYAVPSSENNASESEVKGDYLEPSAQQRVDYDESKAQQGLDCLAGPNQQVIAYEGAKTLAQSMAAANESSL